MVDGMREFLVSFSFFYATFILYFRSILIFVSDRGLCLHHAMHVQELSNMSGSEKSKLGGISCVGTTNGILRELVAQVKPVKHLVLIC